MASTNPGGGGGAGRRGGTPEIMRKRRENMARNDLQWQIIDRRPHGAGTTGDRSGGGGGGLLFAVAAEGARHGEGGGGGGRGERDGGQGGVSGGGAAIALAPLSDLEKDWPGRGEQIAELAGLIGESMDGVPVPPILVTGPPCGGKTSVVRAVLEHRGFSYVYVNCAEVVQRKDLFEAVVEQVAGGSREGILLANRVDRRFGDAPAQSISDPASTSGPASTSAGAFELDGRERTADDEPFDEDGEEGTDEVSLPQEGRGRGKKRPACSSWNVFFRQLAALLTRRRSLVRGPDNTVGVGGTTGTNGGGRGRGGCAAPPEFPAKLFVVLDNAESLLSESAAGVGVAAGGSGTAGNSWRGQDMLASLAGLQRKLDSFSGFAGAGALDGNASYPSCATPSLPPSSSSKAFRGQQGQQQQRGEGEHGGYCGQPPLPPVCPILISQNVMFASEVMGSRSGGGGGDWRGAGGTNRSLVAAACLVQLRFPPYGPEHLPDVLTAIAHKLGMDLDVDLRATGRAGTGGGGGGAGGESGAVGGSEGGRSLFRKLAVTLVSTLKNETRDPWELGKEAARIWPEYKEAAENMCNDAELSAFLKPRLTEATKRLHGIGSWSDGRRTLGGLSMSSSAGGGGASIGRKRNRPISDSLGLSRSAKHLLVCAYLASHNSRDTDRDMFTSKSTKSRRQRQSLSAAGAGNAENLVEAGVKDLPEAREFQLERLLSIMASIVAVTEAGTKAANSMGSTELFAQVRSLTKLNLLSLCGQRRRNFDLDSPTYRCNVSRELAEDVAKEIGLELSQYLAAA